jgi:recombination protein RecA
MAVKKKTRSSGNNRALALASEINNELKLSTPIMLGSDPYFTIVRVPSGSLVIDRITGGGFALGRHYELFGDESVGKSYVAYRTMALSQARGKVCAIIDPEHAFDAERFSFLGGYPEELLAYHPQTGEDAVAVMMMLAKHSRLREIEVITCDSVASLVSTDEASKDPRDTDKIAAQARMMSKALRRITTVNDKTLFLWTNQEYTNVGVTFGNPNVSKGGKALRYYATGRLEFRKGQAVKEKQSKVKLTKVVDATDVRIGNWVQVRAVKEKSTKPYREGAFNG